MRTVFVVFDSLNRLSHGPYGAKSIKTLPKSGKLRLVQGSIEKYVGDSVLLTTDEKVRCDVSVLAVGWKLGVPVLPEAYRKKLIEDDGQYKTYRLSVNPDPPDMGFVGFNSRFCTVLSAEMIANWLLR